MTPEEFHQQQRQKIEAARKRQAAIAAQAAQWDPIITRLLQKIGQETWGPAARIRHWHNQWEVYAAIPQHPYYRVTLVCDDLGEPTHFVIKCAAGELEAPAATEADLVQTLERATEAGPAGWDDDG